MIFSIVIPVYQNAESLPTTVSKLLSLSDQLNDCQIELVFVNDGSTDSSLQVLSKLHLQHPNHIVIVQLTKNFGQTPAIQAGFNYVSGQCVGVISADLQDPYEKFIQMYHLWKGGEKYIIGVRKSRNESFINQLLSNLYWFMLRHFSLKNFPRTGYDFCLLDRQIVEDMNRMNEKNTSIFPLIYWLGYKSYQIEIDRMEREFGKSQWSIYKKMKLTLDTLFGFTRIPIRFITFCAIVFSIISFVLLSLIVIDRVFNGSPVQGWASTVSLISFFGSLILFSLGIMSEYLLRILDEVRRRPTFVVEQVKNRNESK